MNADLQRYYGVCLTDMYEGRARILDVADFAALRPRGSLIDQWIGGWAAVTAEEEGLRRVEYAIVAVNSAKDVPVPSPPKGVRELDVARAEKVRARTAKAAALASMKAAIRGQG